MELEHTTAYIGIGSNLGDRAGNLLMAVRALMEASFVVTKLSPIYETQPVGIDTNENFLNMVVEIRVTNVSPTQMMARLLRIEFLLGRGDKSVKKPRTVDLDILFFGDTVVESDFLTVPHPRLHLRGFVLKPLSKLAPDFMHPIIEQTISEIFAKLDDPHEVKRWRPNGSTINQVITANVSSQSKA